MKVSDTAFNGLTVTAFRPTVAPNPSCCSDPGVLCANCAALALRQAGITGNELVVNQEQEGDDQDDVLPLPTTLNFEGAPVYGHGSNFTAAVPPRTVGGGASQPGHAARYTDNPDNDYRFGHSGVGLTPAELLDQIGLGPDGPDAAEQAAMEQERRRRLGLTDILPLPSGTTLSDATACPCNRSCHNCEHRVTCNAATNDADDADDVLVPFAVA